MTDPNRVSYQLTYPDEHTNDLHPDHPHLEPGIIYEREHIAPAAGFMAGIGAGWGAGVGADIGAPGSYEGSKVHAIQEDLYVDRSGMHNPQGSPWWELEDLNTKYNQAKEYAEAHPQLQWIGEKHALLNLLQNMVSAILNAKFAVIQYQDYLQRGYDQVHNGDKPSVTWDDFKNGRTDGNLKQKKK
jgi:hypothetical protein